jgi:hypothetical protein
MLAVAALFVFMVISSEPGLEVGDAPSDGEKKTSQARRWASPPAAARKTPTPWTSATSQAKRSASPLRHGHRSLRPVPPAAAAPSRPWLAVKNLPQCVVRQTPKCPQPHRPRTTRPPHLCVLVRIRRRTDTRWVTTRETHFQDFTLGLRFLASSGCWRALLKALGAPCFVSIISAFFGRCEQFGCTNACPRNDRKSWQHFEHLRMTARTGKCE